ncbi:MAG: dihydrofolate reductase [Blastocatellia bacterium]
MVLGGDNLRDSQNKIESGANVIVSLIAAMDRRRGIGFENRLPWRLSADLKRFRELTMGHHIIVGRKTFESIGKPLPGRRMIVVTRDRAFKAAFDTESCAVCHSLDEAIELACSRGEQEVFICGGSEIYQQAIALADRLYLTLVDAEIVADTFFPEFDPQNWNERESLFHPTDEKNEFPFTFKILDRR